MHGVTKTRPYLGDAALEAAGFKTSGLNRWELAFPCAKLGFDTVQFSHTHEPDVTRPSLPPRFLYEIVLLHDLHDQRRQGHGGGGACPDARFASRLSTGWDGELPCSCDASGDTLNCDG